MIHLVVNENEVICCHHGHFVNDDDIACLYSM